MSWSWQQIQQIPTPVLWVADASAPPEGSIAEEGGEAVLGGEGGEAIAEEEGS